MMTDQIGPGTGIGHDYFYFPGDGFGYGYGLAVRTSAGETNQPGSIGELKFKRPETGSLGGVTPLAQKVHGHNRLQQRF
jgi:hypothetical protein